MRNLLWALQYAAFILVTLPLAILPSRISLRLGECIGILVFYLWRSRRNIALENLTSALARGAFSVETEPEAVVRKFFSNLGRSVAEIMRVYYGAGRHILDSVEVRGLEQIRKALEKGKGVLVITGHCGNWELGALVVSVSMGGVNGVARPLDNPFLNKLLERARGKFGNRIIYKKGALREIMAALRRNEVVGILIDQSVTRPEGIIIPFLGKNAYTMKIPAMLARKTGAAVIPTFMRREGNGHVLDIGPEVELSRLSDREEAAREDMIRFTRCIEDYIRSNPIEWLWIHRRWKRIKD